MSDRDAIIARLIAARADLERRGVEKLWLFGSMARGEDGPDSDVDLVFETVGDRPIDIVSWGAMAADLRDLLERRVDIGPRRSLRESVADAASGDMVLVF
jgi:uncharacterized protein